MSIHDDVDGIMAELTFDASHRPTLRARIRTFLTECVDESWDKCTLLVHSLPGGSQVYSASQLCIGCNTIHTLIITLEPPGDFEVASPSPIGMDEY